MARAVESTDVLLEMLYAAQKAGPDRLRSDPVKLHTFFFECRRRKPALFRAFAFDTRDYFPYSEVLESAIDALQVAGYLERTNPRGTDYAITSRAKMYHERELKTRLSSRTRRMLQEEGQRLAKVLGHT